MDDLDISGTIKAKSDQLNADDLVGGPITVTVTGVNLSDGEQPVIVHLSDGHKPWKPCKTMRRLLAYGWGENAGKWIGRRIILYRDASVKWAGAAIGGIRVSAMSNLKAPIDVMLAETKGGKKLQHKVSVLAGAPQAPNGHHASFTPEERARFFAKLGELGLPYEEAVAPWHERFHNCRPSSLTTAARNDLLGYLATPEGRAEVTGFVATAAK
jgi:hypothetical protein